MIEVSKVAPELKPCMSIAYASANMTVYNFHIKNDVKCTRQNEKKMRKAVKDNFKYIYKSSDISIIKKYKHYYLYLIFLYIRLCFTLQRKIDRV